MNALVEFLNDSVKSNGDWKVYPNSNLSPVEPNTVNEKLYANIK